MKKILCLFLCLVPAIYLGGCSDPGKDKPDGVNNNTHTSNDVCGDGKVTGSETCDTAATDPDKQCVTEDQCKAQVTDSCKRGVVQGDGCTVSCSVEDITACTGGDGCCPTGCTADNDSDCTSDPGPGGPGKIVATIGVECTDDSACGQDGKCEVAADGKYKGGYCYAACETTEGAKSCPDGSKCVASKGSETRCMKECTAGTPGSCRDGYECTTDGVCETKKTVTKITANVGLKCTDNSICGTDGTCLAENGLLYKEGYCTADCDTSNDACPDNAKCVNFDDGTGAGAQDRCFIKCGSCRPGYVCDSTEKVCLPDLSLRPPFDAKIGIACTDDAACGPDGKCIKEKGDKTFKEGYCSADCSDTSKSCPKDSKCITDDFGGTAQESFCMKECTSQSSCRNGYRCDASNKVCLTKKSTCDPAADTCTTGSCRDVDGDGFFQCEPYGGQFGTECKKDTDCKFKAGAKCLVTDSVSGKGFCTTSCDAPNTTACDSIPNGTCIGLGGARYCLQDCNPTSTSSTCSVDQFECIKINGAPQGGLCYLDPVPDANIGGACTDNTACGPDGFCLKESGGRYKGGICTAYCSNNGKCPNGSSCGGSIPKNGTSLEICLPDCVDSSTCRTDYTCNANNVCDAPPPQACTKGASPSGCPAGQVCGDSDLDGTYACFPEAEIGKPCTEDAGCTSRVCHLYSTTPPKGFCSLDCKPVDVDCPEGSSCIKLGSGTSEKSRCINVCNDDADCSGQGNPNPGTFSCLQLSKIGVCWNTLDVVVGDPCTTATDCAGTDAICQSIGGYGYGKFCTADCTDINSTCPSGSKCILTGNSPTSPGYCAKECGTTGTCPTGTQCRTLGTAPNFTHVCY